MTIKYDLLFATEGSFYSLTYKIHSLVLSIGRWYQSQIWEN